MARTLINKFRLLKILNTEISSVQSRALSSAVCRKNVVIREVDNKCRSGQVRFGTSVAEQKKPEPPQIKRSEVAYGDLMDGIASCRLCLIDVREPREIEEEGSIPTSTNIPLCKLKVSLQMEDEEFRQAYNISKPEMSNSTDLIFYGRSSVKGLAALEIAHKLGYKKARHFVGGYEEWCTRQKEG